MDPRSYCLGAVAYLKVEVPNDTADVELSRSDSPVLRSFGHGLFAAYLVDEGDHFSYVQNRHLDGAHISPEELHSQAVHNLGTLAEKHAEVRCYGNIFTVLMGGNFEASLILFDQFWSEWYAGLARDLLAFSDAASPVVLAELRALCERTQGNVDHPLSSKVHRRIDVTWEPIAVLSESL